nr:helix-turn-helix domain-containing protein [Arenimonas daejeonensis]
MDTDEAAGYLRMSPQNLELLRLNGGGPMFAKLGRLVRYRRVSLDRWLADNERANTAGGK